MIGTGTLTIKNCDVYCRGDGTLTILPRAHVDLDGTGAMIANGSYQYGMAIFPPFASFGMGGFADGTGFGYSTLPAFTSEGIGDAFVPAQPGFGFAIMPPITSFGQGISIDIGTGSADFPAFAGRGGVYAEGYSDFPAFTSFGFEGKTGEIFLVSLAFGASGQIAVPTTIIFLNSAGQIVDTFSGDAITVASLLSEIEASSIFSVVGEFSVEMLSTATGQSGIAGAVSLGDGDYAPAVNGTSRVWVVNMDTGASSQYDDYGFESIVEHEGSYYGFGEDGIYLLNDSSAAAAPSLIDFGVNDCGVLGRKKILNIHVGTSDGSDTYLKVETDTGTNTYRLEATLRGTTGWRAKVPPSDQGQYWRFTLIADNAFELRGVEFAPAKLSKRM